MVSSLRSSSLLSLRRRSIKAFSSTSYFLLSLILLLLSTISTTVFVNATIYTQEYYNSTDTYNFINSYPSLPALFGRVLNPHILYTGKLIFIQSDPYLCGDNVNVNNINNNNINMLMNNQHQQQQEENTDDENDSSIIIMLAARGECPFQHKAVIAESYGSRVQFLLIYNYNSDYNDNDSGSGSGSGISGADTLIPMYADAYGPGARTRLGLLSITHRTGVELKRYIRDYQYQQQISSSSSSFNNNNNETKSSYMIPKDCWEDNNNNESSNHSIVQRPDCTPKLLIPPLLASGGDDFDNDNNLLLDGPWITLNADPPVGIMTVQDLQTMLLTSLGLFFMLVSFTGCFLICAGTLSGHHYNQHAHHQNNNDNNNAWRNAAPPNILHLPPDLLETLEQDEAWQTRFAQLAAASTAANRNNDLNRDVSILAAMARGRRGPSSSNLLLTREQVQRLAAASSAMSRRRQERGSADDSGIDGSASSLSNASAAHEHESRHEGSGNSEAPCCAVCLDELPHSDAEQQHDQYETVILPCHHAFHMDCIMPWLTERQAKCPLCKMDVLDHVLALDYIASQQQQQQQQQRGQQGQDDNVEEEQQQQELYHGDVIGQSSPWRQFWQGIFVIGPRVGSVRQRRYFTRVSTSFDQHDPNSSNSRTIIAANEMNNEQQQELELVETVTSSHQHEPLATSSTETTTTTTTDANVLMIQIV